MFSNSKYSDNVIQGRVHDIGAMLLVVAAAARADPPCLLHSGLLVTSFLSGACADRGTPAAYLILTDLG